MKELLDCRQFESTRMCFKTRIIHSDGSCKPFVPRSLKEQCWLSIIEQAE